MMEWRKFARRLGVVLKLRDPPNVPSYGWSYFDHLVAVYVTLNSADARADKVIQKSRERAEDLTWGDVFLLENIVFSLQPPEVIERNAWILRERFRGIASASVYERYNNSHFPTESDTPAKLLLLKADLTRVLDVLHWYYSLIPLRERIRKNLTIDCVFLVLVYTALLGVVLVWCHRYHAEFLAMLISVLYCGTIGGFVSSQRRMQSIPTDGDPLLSVFGLDNAGYFLWLSPLLGAIFAVALLSMFIGGILKGSVFPEFASSRGGIDGLPFSSFTWNTLPTGTAEYGKLFVWGFLAGFAERLVPDSLDRLTSKLGGDGPPPPPPPGGPGFHKADFEDLHKPAITNETLENVMHTGEVPAAPDPEKPR